MVMRGRWTIAGAALAVLLAATIGAATENVTMTFCRQVAGREPVGEAVSFSADVGWIYCHITLDNPQAPTQIHHDWYYQGAYISRRTLAVGTGRRWRTFSAKKISPAWVGAWEVVVRDAAERELARKSFTVTPAP